MSFQTTKFLLYTYSVRMLWCLDPRWFGKRILHHLKILLWHIMQKQQIQRLCHFVRMTKKIQIFWGTGNHTRIKFYFFSIFMNIPDPTYPRCRILLTRSNQLYKRTETVLLWLQVFYFYLLWCWYTVKNNGELWYGFHSNALLSLFINQVPTYRQKICSILPR